MRILIGLMAILFCTATFSQKIGHINSVSFIDTLTEAKKIADQITNYEKQLTAQGEQMAQKFKTKIEQFQRDMETGNLTPIQQQSRQTELETEQTALSNYQKSAQESLLKRRDELLKPLLDKINKAITDLGKEEGYMMIFDASVGLLHLQSSDDVTAKVAAKMIK